MSDPKKIDQFDLFPPEGYTETPEGLLEDSAGNLYDPNLNLIKKALDPDLAKGLAMARQKWQREHGDAPNMPSNEFFMSEARIYAAREKLNRGALALAKENWQKEHGHEPNATMPSDSDFLNNKSLMDRFRTKFAEKERAKNKKQGNR